MTLNLFSPLYGNPTTELSRRLRPILVSKIARLPAPQAVGLQRMLGRSGEKMLQRFVV